MSEIPYGDSPVIESTGASATRATYGDSPVIEVTGASATRLTYADSPVIEAAAPQLDSSATSPALLWLGQASGIVVATVQPPALIMEHPISTYTLFRSPSATGPWTQVDARVPAALSRWVNLFDASPIYNARAYYYAAVDSGFATVTGGNATNVLYFVAHTVSAPIAPAGTLSAGALGLYPLLGSDVYVDGISGEGVIGPNGDLLTVNGLECLAQDLRTRITTEQGELLLHPQFGLSREKVIGSGQSNPAAQAQALQARFIDAYTADPRVLSVQALTISRQSWDAWVIDVTLVAIGFEDPQRLNVVVPFYQQ